MKMSLPKLTGSMLAFALTMAPLSLHANDWLKPHATGTQQPILIQNSDARMMVEMDQLREQVRSLNGRVEELTFQLLQMQEQVRKMQEDNEFRFQELEEKESSLKTDQSNILANAPIEDDLLGKQQPSERKETRSDGETNQITEKKPIGNRIFDKAGRLIKGFLKKPLEHQYRGDLGDYSDRLGLILQKDDPVILYKFGRDQLEFGDYILAAETFNVFLGKYQKHQLSPDALYWLGNSYLLQEEFEKSAEIFLRYYRQYPETDLAPETLLNLGITMAGLEQRELACATFAEVPVQYPEITADIKRKLQRQQKGANCS